MKLLKLMFGFIFAMLGLIIAVYSTHHVVGLLLFFGGFYTTLINLPHYKERLLWKKADHTIEDLLELTTRKMTCIILFYKNGIKIIKNIK